MMCIMAGTAGSGGVSEEDQGTAVDVPGNDVPCRRHSLVREDRQHEQHHRLPRRNRRGRRCRSGRLVAMRCDEIEMRALD